jgi:hypothetical protein
MRVSRTSMRRIVAMLAGDLLWAAAGLAALYAIVRAVSLFVVSHANQC